MTELNLQNRTLAIMDNLPFLRSLNNECIDLIAIDPPFAANETFTGNPRPPITEAELQEEIALARKHGVKHDEGRGTTVRDIWTWDENVHPGWLSMIEDDYPPVFAVIKAVEVCASENEAAYIAFMAVRLIECRRVLKSTGSIYVHCDDHANSYLRVLMDAVFGKQNFRNELTWNRSGGKSDSNKWGRVSDRLLYYTKSRRFTWNQQYQPHNQDYVDKQYRYDDCDGRGPYRRLPLHAAGASEGESGAEWRGYDPSLHDRHWATPRKGAMHKYIIEHDIIPRWPEGYPTIQDKLDALDEHGLLIHSDAYLPEIKTYLAATKGIASTDFIADIPMVSGREKTGYKTQKPLALYERIIAASSNPGDTVLDIFAGCATTAVAAERLGRQWIACDIAYRSWTMLKRRFALKGYALSDMTRATTDALDGKQPELTKATSFTIGPNNLPVRSDEDPAPFHNLRKVKRIKSGQPRSARSASWSGRIPKEEAKELLVDRFGAYCWGCGWEAPRFPSGEYDLGLLEVDHIRARRPDDGESGGSDELYNLALLHATCNRAKGNRMTLEELRRHNADAQRIYGHLVPLHEAIAFAAERIASYARPDESIEVS